MICSESIEICLLGRFVFTLYYCKAIQSNTRSQGFLYTPTSLYRLHFVPEEVNPASLSSPLAHPVLPCLHGRNPLVASDGITPPPQSCNSTVSNNPPDMSRWNPFGEDNFSKLTEEELLDREFDMLRASASKLAFFLLLSLFF